MALFFSSPPTYLPISGRYNVAVKAGDSPIGSDVGVGLTVAGRTGVAVTVKLGV
jgi:hypothetical protein